MWCPKLAFFTVVGLVIVRSSCGDQFDEEQYGVRYADECEVCKIVTLELSRSLAKSASSHSVIETGYSIEKEKKKVKYSQSELHLVEVLDEVCDGLLRYNIHKERQDWTRFAPGTSETFEVRLFWLCCVRSMTIILVSM